MRKTPQHCVQQKGPNEVFLSWQSVIRISSDWKLGYAQYQTERYADVDDTQHHYRYTVVYQINDHQTQRCRASIYVRQHFGQRSKVHVSVYADQICQELFNAHNNRRFQSLPMQCHSVTFTDIYYINIQIPNSPLNVYKKVVTNGCIRARLQGGRKSIALIMSKIF